MPKPWKEPQDPKRSFMLRTEGLMRKCKDLTNLGVQVALYIEDVKEGTVLRYRTDPTLLPSWHNVAPLPEEPDAETEPPAVFFGSLRLNCPSTSESPLPLKPTWADLEISKASCGSSASPPSQKRQQHQENRPTTKKRVRDGSPDDAEEQRRKRERSSSTWFND
ncbi:hypothetical protein IWW34DRAFT_848028 [Fusarium oxysporum f. sp. albedinis]|uniref:Uncharacterized protein n=11 Tax=Fusarium oxysporum TaxID=5507 RepID=A0A2H3TPN4_FUSOX|nr:uncharacterized protein FOBCDRAFT_197875 [Fusarium oxysporum Fo47]EGU73042.1 hypothetical protein FOXB_16446 [Fusarium oxysporum f. sp. conglutinans Fo5176]EWY97438.1 hypothetical protein FOYG_02278 [Fusarium oxysporum NRRL 32931]EXA29020.1 hypothetical protein FOVG_19424 [Fusarium oxysporum f. sp. pisi HDV247]EXK27010.1 hypothetical protein FOMG_16448 [Fusarium oxysporum f. sp. melonis 26406]EXL41510.1 hypothetical protein FOCG_16314 [Fusarium oxysporum f. sp. radicis-lycopersici 26381]EX